MNFDGFHYTRSRHDVGYKVPAQVLEDAKSLARVPSSAGWKYSQTVPDTGKNQSVYWFSQEDLEYLMQLPPDQVKSLVKAYKWRSRMNNTTKTRQFYLYDILASVWSYMYTWDGHKLDLGLVEEADERRNAV